MYKNVNFDKSYHKSKVVLSAFSSYTVHECVKDKCLNDNKIVQIIFNIAEKTGVIPNTLDMSFNSGYPQEIQQVLDMLNKEFPAVKGFSTDREAFDTIQSRYIQSPGEIQQLVDNLTSEFLNSRDPDTVEDVRNSNENYNNYGSD